MPITQISGQNIKGLTFTQDIDRLTLFIGPNGAGKSARSQALILALLGYIPGSGKQNADILDNYGDGKEMAVGAKIGDGGILFQRKYARSGETVSQGYGVGGKKKTKELFSQAMGEAGRPVAIDIGAFMALSDQKKIDAVFDLYPPEADISKIVFDIETTKSRINALTATAKSMEEAAARLTTARAAMEIPTGTAAEVHFQIKDAEDKLTQARQDLKDAETEELRQKTIAEEKEKSDKAIAAAEEKGKEDARRELLKEQAEKIKADDVKAAVKATGKVLNEMADTVVSLMDGEPAQRPDEPITFINPIAKLRGYPVDPTEGIRAILDALNGAGCSACAARLVAVRELRKYQGREAA